MLSSSTWHTCFKIHYLILNIDSSRLIQMNYVAPISLTRQYIKILLLLQSVGLGKAIKKNKKTSSFPCSKYFLSTQKILFKKTVRAIQISNIFARDVRTRLMTMWNFLADCSSRLAPEDFLINRNNQKLAIV